MGIRFVSALKIIQFVESDDCWGGVVVVPGHNPAIASHNNFIFWNCMEITSIPQRCMTEEGTKRLWEKDLDFVIMSEQ
jgi:hypothetical protein